MKYLGIDYGRKKIGLSLSDGVIAEPYRVIKYTKADQLVDKLNKIIGDEKIEIVIIGISEGKIAKETERFGRELEKRINLKVVFQDETLSTRSANNLSLMAKINRKKRKEMEDAYAASLILQDYLDKISH